MVTAAIKLVLHPHRKAKTLDYSHWAGVSFNTITCVFAKTCIFSK